METPDEFRFCAACDKPAETTRVVNHETYHLCRSCDFDYLSGHLDLTD